MADCKCFEISVNLSLAVARHLHVFLKFMTFWFWQNFLQKFIIMATVSRTSS